MKCVILVPSLGLSCSGEDRFFEHCVGTDYIALTPGSCVPESLVVVGTLIGSWATLGNPGTELGGG